MGILSNLITECTAMLRPRSVPVSVLETVLVSADVRMELMMHREQVIGNRSSRKSITWLI